LTLYEIIQHGLSLDAVFGAIVAASAAICAVLTSVLTILLIASADRMRTSWTMSALVLRRTNFLLNKLREMHASADAAKTAEIETRCVSTIPPSLMAAFDEAAFSASYDPKIGDLFARVAFDAHEFAERIHVSDKIDVAELKLRLTVMAWCLSIARSRLKWRARLVSSRARLATSGAFAIGIAGVAGLAVLVLFIFLALKVVPVT
jgi:hypothetical protein